jgi:hypothetical protein
VLERNTYYRLPLCWMDQMSHGRVSWYSYQCKMHFQFLISQ